MPGHAAAGQVFALDYGRLMGDPIYPPRRKTVVVGDAKIELRER